MDVEITPEPTDDERRAIIRALELDRSADAPPTPWRQGGLGPGEDDADDQAAAPPRQSRGAARA